MSKLTLCREICVKNDKVNITSKTYKEMINRQGHNMQLYDELQSLSHCENLHM